MPATQYDDSLCMWGAKPTIIAVEATENTNAVALAPGVYTLVSDVGLYFLQGNADTVAADDVSNYLAAGSSVDIEVRLNDAKDATIGSFVSVLRSGTTDGRAFLMKPAAEIV